MSEFIDLSTETEQVASALKHYSQLKKLPEEQRKKLLSDHENSKPVIVLKELLSQDFQLEGNPEQEVIAYFCSVCSLLSKVDTENMASLITTFTTTLSSSTTDAPALRLKMLTHLHQTFEKVKFDTFMALLDYSQRTNSLEEVFKAVQNLTSTVQAWGANTSQLRRLYKQVHSVLKNTKKRYDEFQVLSSYLETFNGAPEKDLEVAKDEAVRACVLAVSLPEVHQCDNVLEFSAVARLEKDAQHAPLISLLRVFAKDGVTEFLNFHQQNPSVLASLGLEHDVCLKKIRMLALSSLGCEKSVVPYSEVAETLQVEVNQVEFWVVATISAGYIDAKMDQIHHTVTFERAELRSFSNNQWLNIQSRLKIWKKNVSSLLQIIQQTVPAGR